VYVLRPDLFMPECLVNRAARERKERNGVSKFTQTLLDQARIRRPDAGAERAVPAR